MASSLRTTLTTFANSRCRAGMIRLGPSRDFATRWLPKVGREFVRNAGDPAEGFTLRVDAIEAAQKYRDACRSTLAETFA